MIFVDCEKVDHDWAKVEVYVFKEDVTHDAKVLINVLARGEALE